MVSSLYFQRCPDFLCVQNTEYSNSDGGRTMRLRRVSFLWRVYPSISKVVGQTLLPLVVAVWSRIQEPFPSNPCSVAIFSHPVLVLSFPDLALALLAAIHFGKVIKKIQMTKNLPINLLYFKMFGTDYFKLYHTVRRRAGLRGRYLPVKSTGLLYTWMLKSTVNFEKHIDHKCFSKIKIRTPS